LPKSSSVRDVSPKYYTINLAKTFEDAYSVSSNVKGGTKEYSDRLTQFSDQSYDNFCNRPQIIANLKI